VPSSDGGLGGWWSMDEKNHEDHEHEEHPGCTCGSVCKITGACGKHELKAVGGVEKEESQNVAPQPEGANGNTDAP
jgi:hypothetical protein